MSVWDDLVGQEPVIEELRSAVDEDAKMAHAWLFTGPPGSGRATAARVFAAALQCGRFPRGCGQCASCHQVLQGTHTDLEIVQVQGLTQGVALTRDLIMRAASAPTVGRWQVVIMEDAERTTEHAVNALLKAIEEPSARTVWLLCSPTPDDMLPTIRSRCRLMTLRTPPPAAIADLLVRREGTDPQTADVLARASQGHVGRALRLAADPDARQRRADVLAVPRRLTGVSDAVNAADGLYKAAEKDAKATAEALNEVETSALRQALGENAKGRMPRGTAGAIKELEREQKSRSTRIQRDSLDRALLDLASYYRDVLTLQLGAGTELVNLELGPELRTAASQGTPEATLRRLDAIMECRERIDANVHPLLAMEALTLALRTG